MTVYKNALKPLIVLAYLHSMTVKTVYNFVKWQLEVLVYNN